MYILHSSIHGAYIENFNKTIKNRLYRWMDANTSERYMIHLDSILQGYNNARHTSTNLSPNLAWKLKSTHPQIREKLQNYYDKFEKKKPVFEIEDIVKIKSLPKSSFFKGYDMQII